MTTRLPLLALAAAAFLVVAPATTTRAQDDALDNLLKKLDDSSKPPPEPSQEKKDGKPAPGEVAPGDQGLDNLLKKLGESTDEPTPEERGNRPRPGMPDQPKPPGDAAKPDQPAADSVKKEDQGLDEHLEGMLRKKKPKDQQQQPDDGSSPLSGAIKKMEEATKRLSDNDTGEQTRKTQGDVVKELDQLLERLRQQSAQNAQRQQRSRQVQQAGQQKGQQQPGEQPGNTAQGTGPQAPQKPKLGDVLAGQKDTWGDLPPHLRDEMENVFREEMLPAKRDLIIKYYSSVARKGRAGGQ